MCNVIIVLIVSEKIYSVMVKSTVEEMKQSVKLTLRLRKTLLILYSYTKRIDWKAVFKDLPVCSTHINTIQNTIVKYDQIALEKKH